MINQFDRLGAKVFDINSRVMGYPATWNPSDHSSPKSARILYKDPTEVSKLLQLEYNPHNYALEYKLGDFDGLKALVDQKSTEQITITFNNSPLSQDHYNVREVHAIQDGKVFLALLEKI